MTTIKNISISGKVYSLEDSKAVPYLSAADEADLEFNGTYRGRALTETTRFVTEAGTVVEKNSLQTFVPSESFYTQNCNGVAYGAGKFVVIPAVSNEYKFLYSSDGIQWTETAPLSRAPWYKVLYGADKFIALHTDGYIAYSTDGITWSETTTSIEWGNSYSTPVYGGGKFVALGINTAQFVYSTDGLNWQTGTLPLTGYIWTVAYGNGVFVALSEDGAIYSADGLTWTVTTAPYTGYSCECVTYGDGKFVASYFAKGLAYSTDGINWTEGSTINNFIQLIYGDGIFVGTPSSIKVQYSKDGINWSEILYNPATSPNASGPKLAYGNGVFVLVTSNNANQNAAVLSMQTSVAEITSLPNIPNNPANSITYGNGRFVSYRAPTQAAYSDDGFTWATVTLPEVGSWGGIAYGGGKFVVPLVSKTSALYSADGATWQTATLPVSSNWRSIAYGGDKFVIIGSAYSVYSTDGVNWTETSLANAYYYGVTYGDGKFVTVANSGATAAYSTDGITWTETTLPTTAIWQYITYGNGMFVAVAKNGGIAAYSTDGINWTQTTIPSATYVGVTYGNDMFVALGTGVNCAYSLDGINWVSLTLPTGMNIAVVYGNGMFVATKRQHTPSAYAFKLDYPRYSKALSYSAAEIDTKLAEISTRIDALGTS